jgi:hypothetical protein
MVLEQKESIYDKMTNAEKEVAQLLKELGIQWTYEQPLFIWDENNRPRVWTPDFYLFHFGIYVEVCGSDKFDYEYRRSIFDKNGYRVIFVHLYKSEGKWKRHLLQYLYVFMKDRNQRIYKIFQENKLSFGDCSIF